MTSRSKRSRKDQPDEAEAPVKETSAKETSVVEEESKPASDEPPVKRGRGRPRKPEHLKKKWISTGRPRGRPRIHPLEPNKPKRPKGRPRIHPIPIKKEPSAEGGSKDASDETSVKKERGRPRKPDYLKTKASSGRPRGRPRIHPLEATNKPKKPRGRPRIHPSKKVTSRGQLKRSKPKKEEAK